MSLHGDYSRRSVQTGTEAVARGEENRANASQSQVPKGFFQRILSFFSRGSGESLRGRVSPDGQSGQAGRVASEVLKPRSASPVPEPKIDEIRRKINDKKIETGKLQVFLTQLMGLGTSEERNAVIFLIVKTLNERAKSSKITQNERLNILKNVHEGLKQLNPNSQFFAEGSKKFAEAIKTTIEKTDSKDKDYLLALFDLAHDHRVILRSAPQNVQKTFLESINRVRRKLECSSESRKFCGKLLDAKTVREAQQLCHNDPKALNKINEYIAFESLKAMFIATNSETYRHAIGKLAAIEAKVNETNLRNKVMSNEDQKSVFIKFHRGQSGSDFERAIQINQALLYSNSALDPSLFDHCGIFVNKLIELYGADDRGLEYWRNGEGANHLDWMKKGIFGKGEREKLVDRIVANPNGTFNIDKDAMRRLLIITTKMEAKSALTGIQDDRLAVLNQFYNTRGGVRPFSETVSKRFEMMQQAKERRQPVAEQISRSPSAVPQPAVSQAAAPEPEAPQPTVAQAAAPEPEAPQPTVVQPEAPQPAVSVPPPLLPRPQPATVNRADQSPPPPPPPAPPLPTTRTSSPTPEKPKTALHESVGSSGVEERLGNIRGAMVGREGPDEDWGDAPQVAVEVGRRPSPARSSGGQPTQPSATPPPPLPVEAASSSPVPDFSALPNLSNLLKDIREGTNLKRVASDVDPREATKARHKEAEKSQITGSLSDRISQAAKSEDGEVEESSDDWE